MEHSFVSISTNKRTSAQAFIQSTVPCGCGRVRIWGRAIPGVYPQGSCQQWDTRIPTSMLKGLILLSRCWKPLRSGCLRVGAGSTLATWWLFSLAVTTWTIPEEEVPLDPYKLLQGHGQVIRKVVQAHVFHFAEMQSSTLTLLGRPQLPAEGGSSLSQWANSVLPQFTSVFSWHFWAHSL